MLDIIERSKDFISSNGFMHSKQISNIYEALFRIKKPTILLLILERVVGLEPEHHLILDLLDTINHKQSSGSIKDNPTINLYETATSLSREIYLGKISKYSNSNSHKIVQSLYKEEMILPIHIHARIAKLLMYNNPDRSDRICIYISNLQNDDGGWKDINNLPHLNGSCIWTTIEIIILLQESNNIFFKNSIDRAITFVESLFLMDNVNSNILSNEKSWGELAVGHGTVSMLAGGTLKYMEAMSNSNLFGDSQFKKNIKWLNSIKLSNDLFPKNIYGKQIPDPYVTVRALDILNRDFFNIKS